MNQSFSNDHGSQGNLKRAPTNCFQPVATGSLPPQISSRRDHPLPKVGIVSRRQLIDIQHSQN